MGEALDVKVGGTGDDVKVGGAAELNVGRCERVNCAFKKREKGTHWLVDSRLEDMVDIGRSRRRELTRKRWRGILRATKLHLLQCDLYGCQLE